MLALLERWKPLGYEEMPDGAKLIGRVPHVAPLAWLHEVFPPLDLEDEEALVANVPGFASSRVREILREFNGCNLFSSELFLLGQCTSYDRSGSVHEPWSIYDTNVLDQNDEVPPDALIIGGSNGLPDGVTMIETRDRRVEAYDCMSPYRKLFEWASVDQWLFAEINRLGKLFDDQGRLIGVGGAI
jgi:hypothetical protein